MEVALLTLHQFPYANGVQPSPPCGKVAAYLGFAGIPFEENLSWDLKKAPKGKLPWIDDNGTVVADSWFILRHLQNTYGHRLNGDLTPAQQGLAHFIERTLDESLYFSATYSRWIDPEGFAIAGRLMFGAMPAAKGWILQRMLRRYVRKMLYFQGIGRHNDGEIYELAAADFKALADVLGDKPFLLGDSPSTADATAYGHLAAIYKGPVSTRMKGLMTGHDNLVAYTERMHEMIRQDSGPAGQA
ncbi:MAG: glutathione S-transferase family protein [Alphaproteobacteria bacterium]